MKTKKTAIKLMLGLLSVVLLFHSCVLLEYISYEKVWAGKIKTVDEMRVFETISILINLLLMSVLFIKFKNIKNNTSNKAVSIIIWIFVFLFAINTVGNLFAESLAERVLGTILTLISSFLCWIIVKKPSAK